ncbi:MULTISPECIES: hypothetical protein [Paraburkholderia]|uniref:hypothetical protein n=1 Tax=Paraburkholderia TaxID=1822464 RepID=UPI00114D364F|nr:hypothetical protein [Paraburkholderia nodosa]
MNERRQVRLKRAQAAGNSGHITGKNAATIDADPTCALPAPSRTHDNPRCIAPGTRPSMQACNASDKFRIGDPQAGDMLGKSSL